MGTAPSLFIGQDGYLYRKKGTKRVPNTAKLLSEGVYPSRLGYSKVSLARPLGKSNGQLLLASRTIVISKAFGSQRFCLKAVPYLMKEGDDEYERQLVNTMETLGLISAAVRDAWKFDPDAGYEFKDHVTEALAHLDKALGVIKKVREQEENS